MLTEKDTIVRQTKRKMANDHYPIIRNPYKSYVKDVKANKNEAK
jgi:GTP:adenosylcobinamide-phosphate guanylyltransferase